MKRAAVNIHFKRLGHDACLHAISQATRCSSNVYPNLQDLLLPNPASAINQP